MSKIITNKDERVSEIKSSVENFLSEISNSHRDLFSYQEIENILLDIYILTNK